MVNEEESIQSLIKKNQYNFIIISRWLRSNKLELNILFYLFKLIKTYISTFLWHKQKKCYNI